jgi:hypothetical protein|tara:strand:- start:699 stop:950 length:252 start_codon:yes stop_codon:yes gene_type:complete
MDMNIVLHNSDLDILNNEIKELKQKMYFIENHLISINSKMETIYQNTILINSNMNKQNEYNKNILNQIIYFTQKTFNYIFYGV